MLQARSSQVNEGSSKKRKSGDVQSFFAGNHNKDAVYFESMSNKYVGKRILLMAADIYPRGGVRPDENKTRWNGLIDKPVRANIIMRDICAALTALLSPGGSDHDSLTAAEIVSNDFSRVVYTKRDKAVLRQFEGASMPAKKFSKFTQDNREALPYVLYENRLTIASSRKESFTIMSGVYCIFHVLCAIILPLCSH
jgi:hypothetical protein